MTNAEHLDRLPDAVPPVPRHELKASVLLELRERSRKAALAAEIEKHYDAGHTWTEALALAQDNMRDTDRR